MKMIVGHMIGLLLGLIVCLEIAEAFPVIENPSDDPYVLKYDNDQTKGIPDKLTTIEQVQKMLLQDPTLPRLTRGEIEDLFDQVTDEMGSRPDRQEDKRALMLVLPYNTKNTAEENLQELYTRPPITKVIESYTLPQPQKFQLPTIKPSANIERVEVGNLAATTYKPSFKFQPNPTTYHPSPPKMKITSVSNSPIPVTSLPLLPDIDESNMKTTRFSSSFNAKDTDWSMIDNGKDQQYADLKSFSPLPDMTSIFRSSTPQPTKRYKLEEYYQAIKPAKSSSIRLQNKQKDTVDIADFTRTLPPRPNNDAYFEFQPLNIGEEIRVKPEIETYLNRFGITKRRRKQIKPEDSGISKQAKEIASPQNNHINTITKNDQVPIKRIDTNINDSDVNTVEQDDVSQLQRLLDNLRELQRLNMTVTAEMLRSIKIPNISLSKDGPDPLQSEDHLVKNAYKRQSASDPTKVNLDVNIDGQEEDSTSDSRANSNTSSSTSTTTTTTTTEEPSTTTEESKNGSLTDLEDSFGGPDPVTDDPLPPPPKKNGFYFLADWNSFLEVGEAGKDQVVVRFNPRIGDPRRFLKVTVP